VFTLAITIGPDHQQVRSAGLVHEISFDLLEFLATSQYADVLAAGD
jgi:hypothetical protein